VNGRVRELWRKATAALEETEQKPAGAAGAKKQSGSDALRKHLCLQSELQELHRLYRRAVGYAKVPSKIWRVAERVPFRNVELDTE
jgi:hypothetical protein